MMYKIIGDVLQKIEQYLFTNHLHNMCFYIMFKLKTEKYVLYIIHLIHLCMVVFIYVADEKLACSCQCELWF